jgi:hypothetical protein
MKKFVSENASMKRLFTLAVVLGAFVISPVAATSADENNTNNSNNPPTTAGGGGTQGGGDGSGNGFPGQSGPGNS